MNKIIDENGRVGIITEKRANGVFARPENVPYHKGDDEWVTGVSGAALLTPTFWVRDPNGSYRGAWFDSPLHAELIAHKAVLPKKG